MKRLLAFLFLGILTSPLTAFASSPWGSTNIGYRATGASDSSFDGNYCPAGIEDNTIFYKNGDNYLNSGDGGTRWFVNAGTFGGDGGTRPDGWAMLAIVTNTANVPPNSNTLTWVHQPYPTADDVVWTETACPLSGLVTIASTTFSNSIGVTPSQVGSWSMSKMLLVVGSGLGMFKLLLPYVIGLVIIVCIVYFFYRAFRFYQH